MSPRSLLTALLPLLILSALARAQDQVELTDGTTLEGRVIYEDDQEVIVLASSREKSVPRAQVKSVRSLIGSLHEALDHWDRLKSDDAEGMWQLASFCQSRGLTGEAQVFAWLVVLADPEHVAAHEFLGHKKRSGGWQAQDGKIWMPLKRLDVTRSDFGSAWKLATLHYKLRTNLPLATALALSLDFERYYRFFYEVFGKELKLREVVEPMDAEVHTDAGSFPVTTDNRAAYFSTVLNTLFVLAEGGLDARLVFHEATHQLLFSTAERAVKARGDVPAWIQEGLAVYMESSGSGLGGHAVFAAGEPVPELFAAHADAKKPFDLPRMFAFLPEDFAIRNKALQKYAQSYSLVHYCLHGEGDTLRPRFFEYLRRVYRGDSSATAFDEALGVREKDFERAWHAYARTLSGH
jgi:small nuclear ribonucleoprotein (snRNP)-like protein